MRVLALGLLVPVCWLGAGCAMPIGPGGAMPGFFFGNVTYPNAVNPNMDYKIEFDADDIEVIGQVVADAYSHNVLGMVSWGDSGYGKLLAQAWKTGGDGVMNIAIDTKFTRVGIFILTFYYSVDTKLSGITYRYKR